MCGGGVDLAGHQRLCLRGGPAHQEQYRSRCGSRLGRPCAGRDGGARPVAAEGRRQSLNRPASLWTLARSRPEGSAPGCGEVWGATP
ncbi:hypothetical protein NDU88_001295 [Pleurodeles waltl]|uniref:Uncharacterized protein n=1 Tax=Pleurodeles waltl TaxID=8319 RepID=A0AAV7VYZ9_PLEWA|nr:hypothetical protein NDU88_001295 [Pleurodeles waltl]